MARREYWVQLENHRWDASPWGVDRLRGRLRPQPDSGLFRPAAAEILVLRRYTENWGQLAAEPLNPWDLTEPGAEADRGAVPGAVLEAKVADEIVVHFRNQDLRSNVQAALRVHGLHAHGAQRSAVYDGTYPLSPPDPAQGNRRGDRVAPGETFTYRWTCPQRAAAGAWLIEDGGPNRQANVALGVLIIRAPGEQPPDLPDGPVRQASDTATRFAAVPRPPKRSEYVLVFHHLPGAGLCLNGRQGLGNTPALVVGEGTRMTVRCLNAMGTPLSVHIHGHRWELGEDYVDTELLPAGGGATLSILSGSAEHGGGLGEWLIVGQAGEESVAGSFVVTEGGALSLQDSSS